MFYLVRAELTLSLSPKEYASQGALTKEKVLGLLRARYEDRVLRDVGYVVAVIDCRVLHGRWIPLDPNLYLRVLATLLVWRPEVGEVVEGRISNVGQTSVYVDLGVLEALCPVSRLVQDTLRYDAVNRVLRGIKTKIVIKKDDLVRARVESAELQMERVLPESGPRLPAISIEPKFSYRVRLSARGPGLGVLTAKKSG